VTAPAPAPAPPVIEVRGLRKHYGGLRAVDGVSFTVRRGEVYGFVGPNGSGKTTTMAMILGVVRPSGGEIRLFGRYGTGELDRARRRIGAMLETPNYYPYLSGWDNLRISAAIKGVGADRTEAALARVGLLERADDAFERYSLGMKHRLAIAGALLGDPELVVLDEPTNGLDPVGIREIRDIVRSLAAEGRTVFLSSHLLHEVERTSSRVAILRRGRIVAEGTLEEITAGTVRAELRAADAEALHAAVAAYPGASTVRRDADAVVAELADPDLAALNRYLVQRGVFVSHLAGRRPTLEEIFDGSADGAGAP
jgi:ABC-type multidrug transport system ATPase subunit